MSKDNYKILISFALQGTFLFVLKNAEYYECVTEKKLAPIFKITIKWVKLQPK